MTKGLSKILCEIAGIEAKEIDDLTCEGLEDVCEDCFSSYKCVTPCCCDNPKLEDKVREILSRNKKLVYPNFESPENFVKLLEIPISNDTTITTHINWNCPEWKDRKEFLQALIKLFKECNEEIKARPLEYYYSDIFSLCEELKQALQAEKNWRY